MRQKFQQDHAQKKLNKDKKLQMHAYRNNSTCLLPLSFIIENNDRLKEKFVGQ